MQLTKAYVAKTSRNQLLIDLLCHCSRSIYSPLLDSVATSLYDVSLCHDPSISDHCITLDLVIGAFMSRKVFVIR